MRLTIVGIFLSLVAFAAAAQTPAEALKGKWVAETLTCGTLTMTITSVETGGMVRGTFECPKQSAKFTIGDKVVRGQQLAGTLNGAKLKLEGSASTTEVTLAGTKMSGHTAVQGGGRAAVTFNKR